MSISKKTRFEVFKRDSFTCQYCGRSAPDVTLNADHIDPRANGGSDDIINLITSCYDCNQGKKDRLLSDHTVVQKRKRQLDELQERREQLETLMEWQRDLMNLDDEILQSLHDHWQQLAKGYQLGDSGLKSLQKWIKKYDLIELADAMRISADQYLEYPTISEGEPKATQASVEKAFDYIPRIIAGKNVCKKNLTSRRWSRWVALLNRIANNEALPSPSGAGSSTNSTVWPMPTVLCMTATYPPGGYRASFAVGM